MKKVLSFLIVLVMLIGMAPSLNVFADEFSGKCGDNLTWALDENGTLTISGTGEMYNSDSGWSFWEEYSGEDWYWSERVVKQIIVEEGVTTIGSFAFSNLVKVTQITFPDSIININPHSLQGLDSLLEIIVGENNSKYCSDNGILYNKNKKMLIKYPEGRDDEIFLVPENVEIIRQYAFFGANFKKVILPKDFNYTFDLYYDYGEDQVIGEDFDGGCFFGCKNLESIEIEDNNSTYRTENGILYNKDKTTLIKYPGGKQENIFSIPNTVIKIGMQAFCDNQSLTAINIPKSVTLIDNPFDSFVEDKIKDIYYSGTEKEWEQIDNEEEDFDWGGDGFWDKVTVHYNSTGLDTPDEPIVPEPEDRFKYYSDEYFENSSYTYNPSLATMSMYLAHSAYASDNTDNTKKSENVKKLLLQCDFDEETYMTNSYLTGGFDNGNAPTTDSIGVAGASKPLGDYTLIAIAVRGGGYGKEWASNFTIGPTGQHQGFMTAKENVLDFINKFIIKNNISGKIKIWITGFSRAAATANLTAAALDDGTAKAIIPTLDETVSLSNDDLYAYCFETPAGGDYENEILQAIEYTNIFNIINPNDPVPKVAPAAMGFGRYGIDKILPAAENMNQKDYDDAVKQMTKFYKGEYKVDTFEFKKIKEIKFIPELKIIYEESNNPIPQSIFLDDFIDILSNDYIGDRFDYSNFYQKALREIISAFMGESKKKSDTALTALIENLSNGWKDILSTFIYAGEETAYKEIYKILTKSLDEADIEYNKEGLEESVVALADILLSYVVNYPNYIATLLSNNHLFDAHDPLLCLAWLQSMDENFVENPKVKFSKGTYRIIKVNCPIDVTVKDENGDVVAQIINDEPQKIANSSIIATINDNGEKVVYLPSDSNYDVHMTATDNGEMNYSINEYNPTEASVSRIVNYYNISVNKDDVLVGEVPEYSDLDIEQGVENGSNTPYSLSKDANQIPSSNDIKGDDVKLFNVNVTSEDNSKGIVMGSSSMYEGNFAQVEAIALEGYEFDGWYAQNVQISQENPYRFCVTQDIELTAKFKEAETYPLEFECEDGGQIIVGNNGNYYEGKKIDIEAKAKSGYIFAGWATSNGGTFANANSSSTTFTMPANNTTITAKFSKVSSGSGGGGVSTYTVKFETNGGSTVKAITVNKNAVAAEPTAPTKDGFKFDGWYTDKELTTAYDFTAKVTKSFTLYAKWTEIEKEPEVDNPDKSTIFTDVKATDWFYENVQYVVENKLMNGVGNDKFAPNDTLTRAMLVTVLYRNAGEPATNRSIPFADIDMGAYYSNAVSWAKQNGIVSGVTENEFAPDANITREQIATIMFRYAQYKGMEAVTLEDNLHFTDSSEISEYAVSAMNWAVGTGLMKGKSATTINPKDNATRAEIAAILQRFIEANK